MKTVRLDEEAYALLQAARVFRGESMSSVVKRVLGERGWATSAGGWKGMKDGELRRLRQGTNAAFGDVGRRPAE